MRFKMKNTIAMAFIIILAFAFSGCTKYASEQDLQELERQKNAALSAERKVEDLKREKSDLERQLAQKKRDLNEAKNILNEVKR